MRWNWWSQALKANVELAKSHQDAMSKEKFHEKKIVDDIMKREYELNEEERMAKNEEMTQK